MHIAVSIVITGSQGGKNGPDGRVDLFRGTAVTCRPLEITLSSPEKGPSIFMSRHNHPWPVDSIPGLFDSPTLTRYFRAVGLVIGLVSVAPIIPSTAVHAASQGRVEITNERSGLKADVMWGSKTSYQGVFLWRNNTSYSQEFDLLGSSGGYLRIRAVHSGKCLMLDDRAGAYRNGTRVVQNTRCATRQHAAEWRRSSVNSPPRCSGYRCSTTNSSYQVLINRATGRCLDADNGSGGAPEVQAILPQWDCIHSPDDRNSGNQIWRIGDEASL